MFYFPLLQDDSTGEMIFDEVFHALSRCLAGLTQPFKVPGTDQLFKPKIFITILAYSSIIGLTSHQVLFFKTVLVFACFNFCVVHKAAVGVATVLS